MLSGRCKTHHGSYVVAVMTRILIALLAASPVMAIEAVTMEALTGGRPWKLAWLAGNGDQLMVLDPSGEPRELLSGRGRLAKPLISADGSSVVVTRLAVTEGTDGNSLDPEILSIPWTGGTARSLGSGMAIAIWPGTTPESPFVYAFAALSATKRGALTGETIVRFHPAKPEEREIIWSERSASPDNFQLSRDGSRACGLFPWPQAGLADLTSQKWTGVGHGSWPTLAPDDSYAMLLLDGSRKQLRCYVPQVDPGWKLNLAEMPTLSGGGINHLRWSNDATIITFTGPWDDEGKGDARIQAVRLRPDLKSLEAVHVSAITAGNPDSPDLWVSGSATSLTSLPQAPQPEEKPAAAAPAWPTHRDGLTFAWDHRGSPHDPVLKGMAFYGPGGAVNVSAGLAEFPAAATAPGFEAVQKSGSWSLECLVTERRSIPPLSVRSMANSFSAPSRAAAVDLPPPRNASSSLPCSSRTTDPSPSSSPAVTNVSPATSMVSSCANSPRTRPAAMHGKPGASTSATTVPTAVHGPAAWNASPSIPANSARRKSKKPGSRLPPTSPAGPAPPATS